MAPSTGQLAAHPPAVQRLQHDRMPLCGWLQLLGSWGGGCQPAALLCLRGLDMHAGNLPPAHLRDA